MNNPVKFVKMKRGKKIDIWNVQSKLESQYSEQYTVEEYQIYYWFENRNQNNNRVTIIIETSMREAVMGYLPISDRTVMLKSADS